MQTKKYTTVSKAIKRARSTVVYPALIMMMLVMAAAIYILVSYDNSFILTLLSISLMILSFVAFGVIMTYLGDKWKTWAYKNVDDVREFRERAANNNFSVNIFPSRQHLSIKKERLRALKVVRERIKNNTLKILLNDDYSIPRKLEIKRSLSYYLVPLGVCMWACYKTTGRLIDGTSTEFVIDVIFSLSSFMGIAFFLMKLIQYPTLVSISEDGIWSKKTGFQSWNMVKSFGFLDKRVATNRGVHISNHLYITFKPESGLESKKSMIDYDILYLNKKSDTIEKTMKVYYHRHANK
ncbi:hypothetical protein [uncultured Proteiniphilum sp.]|uniref:hypothetical protein n=1 Tax=uncultured Proteiniphilum sp. TaxID=497637 RepID=UPI0026067570|nr:hypothetical protein [uncultured Proteiniphilum sp.]